MDKALSLNIPLRGGVVAVREGQRVQEAARDLWALGVSTVGGDRTRAFGRASNGAVPAVGDLCGHCAHGRSAQQHVLAWAAHLKAVSHHLIEQSAPSEARAAHVAGPLYRRRLADLRARAAAVRVAR